MKNTVLVLILVVILTGCGGASRIPVEVGSQTVVSSRPKLEVISRENIEYLEEIERWGKGSIYDMAFSPDEKLIAVSTATGIYFYDTQNNLESTYISYDEPNEETRYLGTPRSLGVEFSTNGEHLAVFRLNHIQIIDVATRSLLRNILVASNNFYVGEIDYLEFSPDAKTLLIRSRSNVASILCEARAVVVSLYDIETGVSIFERQHCMTGTIFPRFVSNEEGVFLSFFNFSKNAVALFNISTRELQDDYYLFTDPFPAYDIAPDGKQMAVFTVKNQSDAQSEIIDLSTSKISKIMDGSIHYFDTSSKYVVIHKDSWEFWNDGSLICKIPKNIYSYGTFSPKGNFLYVDGRFLWNISVCKIEDSFPLYGGSRIILRTHPFNFSPDGRALVALPWIWNVDAGEFQSWINTKQLDYGDYSLVYDVEVRPNHNEIMISYYDIWDDSSLFGFWDTDTGKQKEINEAVGIYYDFSINSDGKLMAIAFQKGVHLFDIEKNRIVKTIVLEEIPRFRKVILSPDASRLVVISSYDRVSEIKFIEVANQRIYQEISVNLDNVTIAISPDWKSVAVPSRDGHIDVVDIRTKELVSSLVGHSQVSEKYHKSPFFLYVPNDDMLISDAFGTMRFWDINSGALLGEFEAEFDYDSFSISPDGRLIAFLCDDGTIRIWGVRL